jgi:TPR repeat protein
MSFNVSSWIFAALFYLAAILPITTRAGMSPKEVSFFEALRAKAEQGNIEAQNRLSICYYAGIGVAKDLEKAVFWLRKAAEQGHAEAQSGLGQCYANGEGARKDHVQAVLWYRKAAEQGDAAGQFGLGLCYANGEGLPKDIMKAISWYRKAAEQGEAQALTNLGYCYANGTGVAVNRIEAYAYWKIASINEDQAQMNLADLEKEMSANQISAGKIRALVIQEGIKAKIAAKKTVK